MLSAVRTSITHAHSPPRTPPPLSAHYPTAAAHDALLQVERCAGANFYTEGEDPILKPDEEYPDWLWQLPTRPVELHEMEEGSKEYWRKLSKMRCIQNNEDSKIAGGR